MHDDDAKRRILARRAKFVAAALASAGLAACSGKVDDDPKPDAAIDAAIDAGDTAIADSPEPCLGAPAPDTGVVDAELDTGPTPCLDVDPDAGAD